MRQQLPPAPNAVKLLQVTLSLLLKATALLLLITIVLRFHHLSQTETQQRAAQLDQTRFILRLEQLKANQNYSTCTTEAEQVPLTSPSRPQAVALAAQCATLEAAIVLDRAQALAAAGQPQAALAAVQPILDRAGVRLWVEAWSRQILGTAREYYRDPNGGLSPAIQTVSAIAPDNALYSEAQQQLQDWQMDWANNQTHWQLAHLALSAQQVERALGEIQQITHPYWQKQAQPLLSAIYAHPRPKPGAFPPSAVESPSPLLNRPPHPLSEDAANRLTNQPATPNYLRVEEASEGLVVSGQLLLPVSLSAVLIALMQLKSR